MKNSYRTEGNVVYIRLDKKDGTSVEAMISIEDLELVSSVSGKWYLNQGYVKMRVKGIVYQLHRFIMGVQYKDPRGTEVDHKDRNSLNNTRCNLRVVTRSQNQLNRSPYVHKGKGVSKNGSGWKATIGDKHLGTFKTKDEAIAARKGAVEELESQWGSIGMSYRTTPR